MIMRKIFMYKNVAYLSRDLALLQGADPDEIVKLYFNETEDEDIEYNVTLDTLYVTDVHDDVVEIPTNGEFDGYFDIDFNDHNLSRYTRNYIKDKLTDFADEFDAEDYFTNLD